ncbi:MAG: periplasmic heavy metal sensor [Deltaproteobacteria bacterium]|jgi:zinc resistance-associated protein|nr:periplasmic heavy metal sensor [Deltaproteobacteria bacterium]
MNTVNFRVLSLSLALAAALGLSGLATAADSCCEAGVAGRNPEKTEACCGSGVAGLNPKKQALANRLYEDFSKSTEALRRELISKRHELGAQMYSATPDENRIQALAREISELRAKLHSARVSLKGRLLAEGVTLRHGGRGRGMGRGQGCGGCL